MLMQIANYGPVKTQPEKPVAALPHGVNASGGIAYTVDKGAQAVLDNVPVIVSGSVLGVLKNPA